jgi:Predicted integral membrane protein (DUF2269)
VWKKEEKPDMSLYSLALFLHVSGAIGTFVSPGIWLFGLAAMLRAKLVEQVRALAWLIIIASPVMVLSVLLLGVGGLAMALSTWGISTPWIAVSLVSVVLIGPIGAFVLDPRMRTILAKTRELPDGPLSDALFRQVHEPMLHISVFTLTTLLLGIVFLMTTRPSLLLSLLVMGIALILGLSTSLLFWATARRRARSASPDRHEVDPFLKQSLWTRRW